MSMLPLATAICKGEYVSCSGEVLSGKAWLILPPCSRHSFANSKSPSAQTPVNGVMPKSLGLFTSAPWSIKYLAMSRFLAIRHRLSGVSP